MRQEMNGEITPPQNKTAERQAVYQPFPCQQIFPVLFVQFLLKIVPKEG